MTNWKDFWEKFEEVNGKSFTDKFLDSGDFEKELLNLKPEDFYFEAGSNSEGDWFIIVPKEFYDLSNRLIDVCEVADHVVPYGFSEDQDANYSYDGDPQVGRQLLLQAGFIEKKMF